MSKVININEELFDLSSLDDYQCYLFILKHLFQAR